MSRPLRIEFAGAVYHVTSRGDRREQIYRDDEDRRAQLGVLAQAMSRFDASVLAYCLMGNHYHLVLSTQAPNLSRMMRHLNGVYTQDFNRRHGLVGHLFQGRFKAILVDTDAYLLSLCRYVERNPVAAHMVARPGDWAWSSYRAHVGQEAAPAWLDVDKLHGQLLGHDVLTEADQRQAQQAYEVLVNQLDAGDATFWKSKLTQQVYLGDAPFAERMQAQLPGAQKLDKTIPKVQRLRALSWPQCLAQCDGDRARALFHAYRDAGLTMTQLAKDAGLSVTHVSRLISRTEAAGEGKWET
jgi:putative transposase